MKWFLPQVFLNALFQLHIHFSPSKKDIRNLMKAIFIGLFGLHFVAINWQLGEHPGKFLNFLPSILQILEQAELECL